MGSVLVLLLLSLLLLVDLRSRPERWSAPAYAVRMLIYLPGALFTGGLMLALGDTAPVAGLVLLPLLGIQIWHLLSMLERLHLSRRSLRWLGLLLVLAMLVGSFQVPRAWVDTLAWSFTATPRADFLKTINPEAAYRVRL